MAIVVEDSVDNNNIITTSSDDDTLLPWLRSIKEQLDRKSYGSNLCSVISDCILAFKHNSRYQDDARLLKVLFLYLDGSPDFRSIIKEIEESKICRKYALRYELHAAFLEAKECWLEAHRVYQTGILREAQPLQRLKNTHSLFLKRLSHRVNQSSLEKVEDTGPTELGKNCVNVWSSSTMNELLKKINHQITKYAGYRQTKKSYNGKVSLSSLQNASRNKILEIGGKKYQIKGCAGKGGFAEVFKAYIDGNPDDLVALKIQKPAFPWEFYMYRQLDHRIPENQRSGFGFAHAIHVYSDCSILVCDYHSHGTLLDVINSYVVIGKHMEEELCIYYTIEMLYMLETLHGVGIIHGDFKPDNLLIRYSRDSLTEDGFYDKTGPWADQGLCLVDWGRGIDLHLFHEDVEFEGDCRTSGFHCIEMQEKRKWKFQVDTYGLCVVAHMMLHNSYMEVEKKAASDGSHIYLPKTSFKRYWNGELWKNFFTRLLNNGQSNDKELLHDLRQSFQHYICSESNRHLLRKLMDLQAKQRISLCGA